MPCTDEDHKLHICALKSANVVELIRCLCDQPTVECADCGARVNQPESVCDPVPLAAPAGHIVL